MIFTDTQQQILTEALDRYVKSTEQQYVPTEELPDFKLMLDDLYWQVNRIALVLGLDLNYRR
jgi:hypothetical protein